MQSEVFEIISKTSETVLASVAAPISLKDSPNIYHTTDLSQVNAVMLQVLYLAWFVPNDY